MKRPVIFCLALALVAVPAAVLWPQDGKIVGAARVIDGDSIIVNDQHIRLAYIDAPELMQPCRAPSGELWQCGKIARLELARLIGNEIVSCSQVDRDRYERIVAICHVGEIDIGQAMVSGGWAVAYKRYSERYIPDEQAARTSSKGIWQSEFIEPEIWRMQKRGGQQ